MQPASRNDAPVLDGQQEQQPLAILQASEPRKRETSAGSSASAASTADDSSSSSSAGELYYSALSLAPPKSETHTSTHTTPETDN